MMIFNNKFILLFYIFILFNLQICHAGPPFNTDDPETLEFRHWEYYISSVNTSQYSIWSGTSPHFEINYGLVPNVQIHLLLPVNYNYTVGHSGNIGYADTEFGIKYRFVQESDNIPQIGTFPILEIPTVKNSEFSNGKAKVFLPLWAQKSWGRITTYGGAGYWINPGTNNKNWIFSGWEVQYNISAAVTLGGELFYHSANTKSDKSGTGFNIGGSINPSEKFHIIFSLGHSISNDHVFSSYLGLLLTI
jgi:hypothetical protein